MHVSESKTNGKGDAYALDGLENVITGLGVAGRDAVRENRWTIEPELTQADVDAMYVGDFIARSAVDKPAANAVRRWFDLKLEDEDANKAADRSKAVMDALEDLRARETFREALRLDGKDGGCLLVFGVNDGEKDL